MLNKTSITDFDGIYDIMQSSFQSDEYRLRDEQLKLFKNPYYSVYSVRNNDSIVAFAAIWTFSEFTYIEHLAVDPNCRNGGMGSRILREIADSTADRICLEVELPKNDIARRRIDFYKRNGFFLNDHPYIQPPISTGKQALPLLIMTTLSPIDRPLFEEIKTTLYSEVYKYTEPSKKTERADKKN